MLIHSSSHDVRDEVVKACQFAAEKGATRIPVSMRDDLSDTTVMRCVVAMDAVRRRKVINAYMIWLDDYDQERLDTDLARAKAEGHAPDQWLREEFQRVTGMML